MRSIVNPWRCFCLWMDHHRGKLHARLAVGLDSIPGHGSVREDYAADKNADFFAVAFDCQCLPQQKTSRCSTTAVSGHMS